ncbi:peptidylprolyl isomerase [Facilibium subflavum]|uniref:peptidylprolyl isomerase n=1 Tax=Facilibium subflavum TaxID=2219058 RepID=UPI0013C31088|nr:peptidylprolyl isomerase [Facilibium subflavum]
MRFKKTLALALCMTSSLAFATLNFSEITNQNQNTPPSLLQKPQASAAQNTQPPKGKHLINEIVAVVNDQPITLDQLNAEVIKSKAQIQMQPNVSMPDTLTLQRQVLQQLINQTIALQMAKRQGISVPASEVNATIDEILAQNGITMDSLKQKLKASGLDFEDYFKTMQDQLMINKLQQRAIAGKIYIPPAEIDKYIAKHFTNKNTQYQVQNILLPLGSDTDQSTEKAAIQKAKDIIDEIKSNKLTFSEAAQKYSKSTNASSGGLLGWKTLDQLPGIYAKAVENMKKGQISAPFVANNGVQIVRLVDIKIPKSAKHFVEQYKVRQIVIDTTPIIDDSQAKAKLLRIVNAIKNGQSFANLAKSNSDNHDNADQGGSMGWVSLDGLPGKLAQEIKNIQQNTVSQPFKVGNSWQIIEVTGKRQKDNTKEFQKTQALNALFQNNAQQAVKTWMMSLRDNAYVKILDPKLELPK